MRSPSRARRVRVHGGSFEQDPRLRDPSQCEPCLRDPSQCERGQRDRGRSDRGSVTAELAVGLPAVVLVLACCLSAMQLSGLQLRLQDAAAVTARAVARGGTAQLAERLAPGARVATFLDGALDCVRLDLDSHLVIGTLVPVTLTASSCAPGAGH